MEYIEKTNLKFFVYDAKAEVQKRICSGQFTIVDDDFATLGFKCGVDYVMDVINETEVEDVAPVRHAYWIESKTFEDHRIMLMCSHCTSVYDIDKPKKIMYRYCPHCGAKMDEKD